MKSRYNYKACYTLPNHHKDVKKFNIRKQYRIYLAEMESYKFIPLDFKTWYGWNK